MDAKIEIWRKQSFVTIFASKWSEKMKLIYSFHFYKIYEL